jgi:5-methylcytosine-specific restriction endonuclease McrA
METKVCIKCAEEKPVFSFTAYKKADGSIARVAKCHTCKRNKSSAKYRPYQLNGIWVKFCKNCQTTKLLEDFVKRLKSYGCCKICNTKQSLDDYHKNFKASPERRQKKRETAKSYAALTREERNARNRKRYRSDFDYRTRRLKSKEGYQLTPEQKEKYRPAVVKGSQTRRARERNAKIVIPFSKDDIIKRDGLNCYLCGKLLTEKTATIEHLIPLSRGGNHKPENVRLACVHCNSTKNNKTLTEYKKWRGDYNRLRAAQV